MIFFVSNCIKIERLLRENCKKPVVGDVSLTGAIGSCSSYQQPGRRRGLTDTSTRPVTVDGVTMVLMI